MSFNRYPQKVYASVLMLDGRVVDYEISYKYWRNKYDVTYRGQIDMDDFDRLETRYTCWEVNNEGEHRWVYQYLARRWIESQR